jgi:hypothetical protein
LQQIIRNRSFLPPSQSGHRSYYKQQPPEHAGLIREGAAEEKAQKGACSPLNGMSPFSPIIEAAASAEGGKGGRGC